MDFKDLDTSLKVTLENITMYSCWLKVNYSNIVSLEKSARSSFITKRIGFIDSNRGAVISFLKKSGLVDAELKPSAWAILLADEKITYQEYCLIHLSKQSLYLGDEPKYNLLNVLLKYITNNHTKTVYSLNDIRILDTDLKPVENNVNSNRRTDYCMTILEGTGLFEHVGKIDEGNIKLANNASEVITFLSTKSFSNVPDKINSPERFNRFAKFDKDSIEYISNGHPKGWNSFFPHLGVNADFLNEIFLSYILECATLIQKKYNVVLTGAPGTGKTYLSKQIAARLIGDCSWEQLSDEQKSQIGFVQFHPSYDYTDFVEGLRPGKNGEFRRQDGVFKEFCKRAINEAYGYEQTKQSRKHSKSIDNDRLMSWIKQQNGKTIKSIKSDTTFDLIVTDDEHLYAKTSTGTERPISYNAVIKYIQTGDYDREHKTYDPALGQYILDNCPLFSESVDNASDSEIVKPLKKKDFVFIIDEINRGELSKIFGELFYSIEPDYRGPKGTVQTQYNNMIEDDDIFKAGFYVPENVYIIGTMNDVDRGVEAMDFAIRRRFGWKEVTAEESADNMGITGLARVKMDALNKALIEKGLTKAHCIGGAYFRKLEGDDFKALWDYHLEGIIFEYFRGEPDAPNKIEEIKKAYFDAKLPKPAPKAEESALTKEGSAE